MKKILIFGQTSLARVLYEDISRHSNEFSVEAFTLDDEYIAKDSFCNKPLVGFSSLEKAYPPGEYGIILAVNAISRLRVRMEIFNRIKYKGYYTYNYISPLADVSWDIAMGESNIILAYAHVGFGGIMGNANFVWQNTFLGHNFNIGNGNTISAGCTISGFCSIGDSCFIGVGATVTPRLRIAEETLIGAGAVVIKDTEPHTKYVGNPAKLIGRHENTGVMVPVNNPERGLPKSIDLSI